jgi:hypothetical protein
VNWKLGNDTTLDTVLLDGISDIFLVNSLPPPPIMEPSINNAPLCYDVFDSMAFDYDADIRILRTPPFGHPWSYDMTGLQTSPDSDYFYDFILHEIGHAHLLNHINDTNSLMYFNFRQGRRVNILSGTPPGPQDLYAGYEVVSTDSAFIDGCQDGTLKNIPRYCTDPTLAVSPVSENKYTLDVYPNPAGNGDITIAYQLSTDSYVQFKITDCIGRAIIALPEEHESVGAHTEQINVTNLAQGVYLLIANINGECQTIKFIKL